jgi:histone-lysine N-methyltransferase SETMAR
LNKDRQLTCQELAESLDISVESIHVILTRHLRMRRVSATWVPHHLMRDKMTDRLVIAKNRFKRRENEGEQYLNRIVAIDETWPRSYEPERKSQS